MPAAAPWLDQAAPPQWSTFVPDPGQGVSVGAQANSTAVDTTLHWKISGTIILALIVIFGLQAMGFRFVTSANVTLGVGR